MQVHTSVYLFKILQGAVTSRCSGLQELQLLRPDLPREEALKVLPVFVEEIGCLFETLKLNPILFTRESAYL